MKKTLFLDAQGRLRMAFAAPFVLIAFFAAQVLGARGFALLSEALLGAWGVTGKTLPYAPAWLQTAITNYGSLEAIVQGLLGFLSVAFCAKFLRKRALCMRGRHILLGAGIGFGLSAAAFAVLFGTGSVRCMAAGGIYPLSELIAALGAIASAFAPEALLGGFFYPETHCRPWIAAALFTVLNALLYVLGAVWSLPSIACVLAMSAACAALYMRRSFAAAAALRSFFGIFAHRLFGFSATGAPGLFFETFPVARDWLTGGDLGLESGWLCAALFGLCAAFVWIFLKNDAPEVHAR